MQVFCVFWGFLSPPVKLTLGKLCNTNKEQSQRSASKIHPDKTCDSWETERHIIITRELHPPILRHSASGGSVLLRLTSPVASPSSWQQQTWLRTRARGSLAACWGIICTSSWSPSNTLHWMTGGRHRSAKCRDLGATPDGNEFKSWHFEIKGKIYLPLVCQRHLRGWHIYCY